MLAAMPFLAKFLPETTVDADDYLTDTDEWYLREPTGNTWFVDGENGKDTNNGKSFDKAFKSYGLAIDSRTANRGDVIYLMPSHEGMVTGDLLKPGIHTIGLSKR